MSKGTEAEGWLLMGKISLPTELAYFVIPTVENLIFSKM